MSKIEEIESTPNGCGLYLDKEAHPAGGRVYYSDEGGLPVQIWDTCMCSAETLLAAIVHEARLLRADKRSK